MSALAEGARPSRLPLAALLVGHFVSLTGNMLTVIALPLYVFAETGSAAATGISGFFATLPIVLGALFGGVVVDRVGYRNASVLADLASAATIVVVPLLAWTVGLPFPVLLAIVFLSGLLDAPGQTARSVLLPEAATAAGVPVERAVGTFEATERAARLAGAPVAGLLVAVFGPLSVLALDAVTFVLSAGLVARFVPRAFEARVEEPGTRTGYWREFGEGLRFTATDPLLRAVVLLVLVTNMFDAAKATVLLPVYAERHLGGAVAFGLLVGAMGAGALVGSLVYGVVGHRLPRRPTFVISFVFAGAPPFLALAAGLPLPALLAIACAAGFSAGSINPMLGTVKLERVPAGMRARVYGVANAGSWAAVPLGALLGGLAVERVGLTPSLVAIGVAYVVVTLTPVLGGPWRGLDRRATVPLAASVARRPTAGCVGMEVGSGDVGSDRA